MRIGYPPDACWINFRIPEAGSLAHGKPPGGGPGQEAHSSLSFCDVDVLAVPQLPHPVEPPGGDGAVVADAAIEHHLLEFVK